MDTPNPRKQIRKSCRALAAEQGGTGHNASDSSEAPRQGSGHTSAKSPGVGGKLVPGGSGGGKMSY